MGRLTEWSLPRHYLASIETQTQQARDSDGRVEAEQFATLTPDTLVRVPVNKGGSGNGGKEDGREGVE